MKPPHSTLPVLAAILIGGVVVSGCTAAADDGQGEPPIDVQRVSTSRQVDLPLARYLAPPADEKAYFAAVNVEQRRCASEFQVRSQIPIAEQPALVELASARRYGVVNADEVARYGYQPVPSPGQAGDSKDAGWNPDARELLVMNAVDADGTPVGADPVTGAELPAGGCSAEGFRRIDEGELPPPNNTLVEDFLAQAWERTKADSRAIKAEAAWSSCMEGHGYGFQHRWDAGNSVGTEPIDVQIQMAKLDLACADESNYVGTWFAVDSAYQRQLIDEHETALEATLADHRAVMERVTNVLEGGA